MTDGVIVLVGVVAILAAAAGIAIAAKMIAEAGAGVFIWPTLEHGYLIQYATRIATTPWWILLLAILTNAAAIMLFGHDLMGRYTDSWGWWLAAALLPVLVAHLIDFRRSRLVACLSFVLVAAVTGLSTWLTASWIPAAIGAPLVLWTFNGLRATIADRMHG